MVKPIFLNPVQQMDIQKSFFSHKTGSYGLQYNYFLNITTDFSSPRIGKINEKVPCQSAINFLIYWHPKVAYFSVPRNSPNPLIISPAIPSITFLNIEYALSAMRTIFLFAVQKVTEQILPRYKLINISKIDIVHVKSNQLPHSKSRTTRETHRLTSPSQCCRKQATLAQPNAPYIRPRLPRTIFIFSAELQHHRWPN